MTNADLDTAIAERVMGWTMKKCRACKSIYWVDSETGETKVEPACSGGIDDFEPTTSHDDFMLAWEKLTTEQQEATVEGCPINAYVDIGLPLRTIATAAVWFQSLPLPEKCRAMIEAIKEGD